MRVREFIQWLMLGVMCYGLLSWLLCSWRLAEVHYLGSWDPFVFQDTLVAAGWAILGFVGLWLFEPSGE